MTEKIEDYKAGIATRARQARLDAGLTQVQVVMKTGIPQTTLSKIERRGAPFSLTSAYRLAAAYDVSVKEFFPDRSADVEAEMAAVVAG